MGVECFEGNVNIDSLSSFESAFITGTSPKVLPVRNINELSYNPKHRITETIAVRYDEMIDTDIKNFSWERFIT